MRVGMGGLAVWSFLMATAHGAGLMVVPVFVGMSMAAGGEHMHHHMHAAPGTNVGAALIATSLHAASYLAVTAGVAVIVFDRLGVGILRRVWLNLDLVWAAALVVTGGVTLVM